MVYGVLKFINFAHSDIFVLGAWTSYTVSAVIITALGLNTEQPPWWVGVICVLIAIAVCALTALLAERLAYRPLRRAPRLNVLITAIGVSLFLQNLGQLPGFALARDADGKAVATYPFGPIPKSMPLLLPDAVLNNSTVMTGTLSGGEARGTIRLDKDFAPLPNRSYRVELTRVEDGQTKDENLTLIISDEQESLPAGADIRTQPRRNPEQVEGAAYRLILAPRVPIRLVDVLIFFSALALMITLQILVYGTRIGAAMRAVAFNVETAALMGVNVDRVIAFTFVTGASLAAAAAFLYVAKYPGLNQPAHGIWVLLGLKAFVAAVVGGIGDVRGAVFGGFLIAAIEFFGSLYIGSALADVYVFGVLILVLLVRPNGIMGRPTREKV
jgi:branched-chain amino acid transport system permease protein